MSRWGRDAEDVLLDVAYAFGEGLDPIEYVGAHYDRRRERIQRRLRGE